MTDVIISEWLSKAIASPREMKIAHRNGQHRTIEDKETGARIDVILFDGHLYVNRISFPEETKPDWRRGECFS